MGLASNYVLPSAVYIANTNSATVTPASAAVSATKVYDATTGLSTSQVTITGVTVSGSTQSLGYTGTATVSDANVVTANKYVLTSGMTLIDGGSGSTLGVASNYVLPASSYSGLLNSATVSPATVTLSAAKTYDGTTAFGGTQVTITGVNGQSLSYSGATSSSPDVSNNGSNYLTAITLGNGSGSNAGVSTNYTLPTLNVSNAAVTINTAPLTITAIADAKTYASGTTTTNGVVYDSTGTATGATTGYAVSGLVNSQTLSGVTLSSTGGLVTATVTGGPYTITPVTATITGGINLSNYNVTYVNGSMTVNPLALTITGSTGLSKTYDATTALPSGSSGYSVTTYTATNGVLSGLPNSDVVTVAGAPVFSSANAGSVNVVQGSLTLSGTAATNYSISWVNGGTSTITKAVLTVTANDAAKLSVQTDTSGLNGVSYSGFVDGQTSSVLTTAPTVTVNRANATANATGLSSTNNGSDLPGTYSGVLVAAGGVASNYSFSYVNGNYTNVGTGTVLVQVTNTSVTYGTTPALVISSVAEINPGNTSAVLNLTAVSHSGNTYTYTDNYTSSTTTPTTVTFTLNPGTTANSSGYANVGNYQVAATGISVGGGGNIYNQVFTGNVTVTAAPITPVTSGVSKVYDGSNTMTNLTLAPSGTMTGDTLALSGAGTYSTVNAGSNLNYTVSGITLSGTNASNYYLPAGSTYTGSNGVITARPINVTAPSITKVYDGTTAYTTTASNLSTVGTASGLVAGNTVASLNLAYASTNAGTGISVTPSAAVIDDGNSGNNYSVTYVAANTGAITQATAKLSATKVYDGTTGLTNSQVTITGVTVNGATQVLGYTGTASTSDSNVSTSSKYVVATGMTLANGGSGSTAGLAANYVLPSSVYDATQNSATVTPATATISATKTYDGTTTLSNSQVTITGVTVNGSTQTLGYTGTAALSDANVATANKYVVDAGITLANGNGGVASNYVLPNSAYNTSQNTASISPATVMLSATKTYDGTAMLSGSQVTVTGVNGETLGYSNAVATSANVAANGSNYLSSISLLDGTGLNAGVTSNYVLPVLTVTNAPVTITPAPLVITASNDSKIYGSTTTTSSLVYNSSGVISSTTSGYSVTGLVASQTLSGVSLTSTGALATTSVVGGPYAIVASGATLSGAYALSNYSVSYVDGSLTVTPAAVTVTSTNQTSTYGSGIMLGTSAFSTSGLLNGNSITSVTLSSTGSSPTANAGTYSITGSNATGAAGTTLSNYTITYVNGVLTVNQAALSIVVTVDSKSYGSTVTANNVIYDTTGNSATSTVGYVATGLVNSQTLLGVNLASAGGPQTATVAGGPYTITASGATLSGGAALSNYAVTYVSGVMTVNPIAINLVANSTSMTYGASTMPALTYQSVSGLLNGDTLSGSLATTASAYNGVAGSASNAGTYAITQGTLTAGTNYSINYTPATLTVNQANLTVTASNQVTTYGAPLVLPQSAVVATGLVNGDYVSSATVLYNGSQVVPSTTNAGSYSGALTLSNALGAGISNYSISYVAGDLTVNKAALTVTAVSAGRFVGLSDSTSYAGVMYSGFQNSDSATSGALGSAVLSITRTNASVNAAGTYNSVLMPSLSVNPQNYTVSYVAGTYTIVPANQLLVQMGTTSTVYSSAPVYSPSSMTVSYCTNCVQGMNASLANIIQVSTASINVSGNALTINDGNGTSTGFTVGPLSAVYSSSNNLSVGSYALGATNLSIVTTPIGSTPNFTAVTVTGGLSVTPLQITPSSLVVNGISKVYDGSVYTSNLALDGSAVFKTADAVAAAGTGTFSSKNVGTNLSYTVGITLSGADATNYQVTNGSIYSGTNGKITQLSSVTYTGPNSGGDWSNPANWTTTGTTAVGAIPDLSNVANVIIPTGTSVVYDNAVAGPVTSAFNNSGNISFNLSNNTTISAPISGSGTVTLTGLGVLTLAGTNSYTGGTTLNAGTSLDVANATAIGTPNITSNGTSINPASLSVDTGVTLPFITLTGGTTKLLSDVTTSGTQSYSSLIFAPSTGTTTTLSSTNAAITFYGTLDGATTKVDSLVANAGTGTITIGASIGSSSRLNNLTLNDGTTNILADVLTASSQTYNGAVFIGDASYLGKTATVGFLYSGYKSYFQFSSGSITSNINILNNNPVNVRTLISEDPNITFNGKIDDLQTSTHTLLVGAITPDNSTASSNASSINFGAAVGSVSPLYSLNAQVIDSLTQTNNDASYLGTISSVGGVWTYESQTYHANVFTARATSQPGTVTLAVYDPSGSLSFLLPLQSNGQMNLQNTNSVGTSGLDALVIDGTNNYSSLANTSGTHNWGQLLQVKPALNYVPTPYVAPTPTTPTNSSNASSASNTSNPTSTVKPAPVVAPVIVKPASRTDIGYPQIVQNYTTTIALPASLDTTINPVPSVQVSAPLALDGSTPVRSITFALSTIEPGSSTPLTQTMLIVPLGGLIQAPLDGMVNVQVKVMQNGSPVTLVSSSPAKGFRFTVPDALISQIADVPPALGTTATAVMADGSALPNWLVFNPTTKTFSAELVPDGVSALEVKVKVFKDKEVVGETTLTINTK